MVREQRRAACAGLRACSKYGTVVATAASAHYSGSLIAMAQSAAHVGFGCVALQVVGDSFDDEAHPLVHRLPDPAEPLLPTAEHCVARTMKRRC